MDENAAIDVLAALAQPTRLATFRLLIRAHPEGVPAGEIARLMKTPQNTMSTHLGILTRAGLLTSDRQSRSIIYRANPEGITAFLIHLINDACEGRASIIEHLKADLARSRPGRK